MRDQYVGDVSDAVKFGFLRALASSDRRLAIAWYYVRGHDGGPDGRYVSWMRDAGWQALDKEVHAGLSNLGERSVAALEAATIWPEKTLFYRDPVPVGGRDGWAASMRRALAAGDLVFLDPDNGIGNESVKHATIYEVEMLREGGRPVALITFPKRKKHLNQLADLHNHLLTGTRASSLLSLRICVSVPRSTDSDRRVPTFRWLTILDPDETLIERANGFAIALNKVPGVKAEVDDFGNFNYGATAAANGFSYWTAQNLAGAIDRSKSGQGIPGLIWPYGDDAGGANLIWQGYQYYQNNCQQGGATGAWGDGGATGTW